MARKTKYFFNPKSLSFERVRDQRGYIRWRVFGFTSLIIVLSLLLSVFVTRFFASPREKLLASENRSIKQELRIMERQVNELESQVGDLQTMDEKIYRAIYEAEPPKPIDYRGSDFAEISNMPEGKLIVRIKQKLEKLDAQVLAQNKSYEQLKKLITSKADMLNSIPAVQPIKNGDLMRMASGFGYRLDPFYHSMNFHAGMDFTADIGTEVYATGDGVVKASKNDGWGYGIHVIVDHGFGYTTLYGHLSRISVRPGQAVKRGQILGNVGSTGRSTGPHLHYEVRKNNNPLNPAFFYHNDLNDEQYRQMIEMSKRETKSFD